MYLTAQRVVARDKKSGINVFLHMHKDIELPALNSPTAITLVAEEKTGTIVDENCVVPPGGNHVKSYLDIVANDNIAQEFIENSIKNARSKIASVALPFQEIIDSVGIRFGAEIGLSKMIVEEYDDLTNAALTLFDKWPQKK